MAALKLVIFDCDGVMFDSKNANRVYYNHMLEKFGHPSMDAEELEYVHMHHVMDSVRHIFRKYPNDLDAAETFRKGLDYTPFLQHMIMEPDLPEFLDFLRPGYKTAISTNRTSTMRSVLEMFRLDDLFDKVVTAFDVAHPKPHPEALHQILTHFGYQVDEAVYIGDSQVDREHTAALGMRLIAFKNPALPAEYHVSSFMEITRLPILAEVGKGGK
ncbi:MAG: HAD family hydrolase [Deltaproteobacteria bacterium]|uniref:HAD family hydrolase n=1 Tax=Hydrosulfovibrio ferrireducens TaxID=2934181 RepID=UPI0011FD2980|nr:MAG: HAD family hydrolase [Deltaproteobacteria bacterium]